MSALEMTANGEKITSGAARQIDDAIGHLTRAQETLRDLQLVIDEAPEASELKLTPRQIWHRLETIDDRIHDALSRLGN